MRTFIFDLYGTIVDIKTDEKSARFWRSIANELSMLGDNVSANEAKQSYLALCKQREREYDRYYEFDLLDVFKDYLAHFNLVNDAHSAQKFASKFRKYSTRKWRVYPRIINAIKSLKRHDCKVYLLSNAQACFTLEELKKSGLDTLFDGIIISSQESVKKPSEEIFNLLIDRYGLDANDCVFVGNDMYDDVLGASKANMRTVYIKTKQSSKRKVDQKPTFIARNFAHLSDILISLLIIDHRRLAPARPLMEDQQSQIQD